MRHFYFKKVILIPITGLFFLLSCEKKQTGISTWRINSTNEIGGESVIQWGNPLLIEEENVEFLEFDGVDDGLLIADNPIFGLETFTIEIDFKPYSGYPQNREQRFFHIQDPSNEDRRILLELRLNNNDEWYGDWFIKSEEGGLALIDSTLTHPVNEWATIGLVYKEGVMKGYVNGEEELSGTIDYLPIGENAKTSVGTRMDKRSWFKGAIKEVRFSPFVLDSEDRDQFGK